MGYTPQITVEEAFGRMNELYPEQTSRVLAELRAEKAEAHIRELETQEPDQEGPE